MNAIILGWFGEKNIGDDLILRASLNILQKNKNIENIYVASNQKVTGNFKWIYDHDFSLKSYGKLFLRGNIIESLKAWNSSDLIIFSVGGGVSDWNKEVMTRLIRKIKFYKFLNKKIIFLGVGAGPFVGNYEKSKISNIFNLVDAFLVRDKTSYTNLKEIGVENVVLTNDVVFELDKIVESNLNLNEKEIVYIPVPLFYNDLWIDNESKLKEYLNSVRESLLKLSSNGYKITIIPFQKEFDNKYFLEYINDLINNENIDIFNYNSYDEVYKRLNECKMIINSRFHGLVLSTIFNKPSISIVYDHKMNDLLKAIGTEETALDVGDGVNWKDNIFSSEEVVSKVRYVLQNYEEIKRKNKKYTNEAKLNSEELKFINV
ncbi:polysaccharide pyruvyl transferase family protein [Paraclostridium bifermentans]|uniref:polysaccharide pyruvyl transferase family protein n=1 Tax=Paraclostridium bifermentans TaxID=1490 RepID=UPI001651FEDF|nr:polysaccharide pyruvyl transferase family protein [Paraclostridium bifermentans]MDU3804002.1 polysaccharide pyruvyl transferase family protein [Paraclostridium bifermentans]